MISLGLCIGEFCSAALNINGKVVGASYEERFHRRKCISGYPYRSIDYLLHYHGLLPDDIDHVSVMNETTCGLEYALVQRLSSFSVDDFVKEAHEYYYPTLFENKNVKYTDVFADKIDTSVFPDRMAQAILAQGESVNNSQSLRTSLIREHLGRSNMDIRFVEHHVSHALYGYLFSPVNRDPYLIFTADSFGDYSNANVYKVSSGSVEHLHESANHNLGRLYRNITLVLGMKPYQHEYKVMGLAPYAADSYAEKCKATFQSFMTGFDGEWQFANSPRDHYFTFLKALEGQRFDSIAGGLQKYFEDMLLQWFAYFLKRNKDCRTVIFSGGLSMNVKANMLLASLAREHGMTFFAAPSADDYSHCISVAYCNGTPAETSFRDWAPGTLDRLDLGYEFGERDEAALLDWARRRQWKVQPYAPEDVANALAAGQILALCHGKAEFGARALGFRSIIADPRDFDTIRRLNVAIKQRDFWMPFAPAVLEGHESEYFHEVEPAFHRYMASAAPTTDRGAKLLRAATHPYDGTARPQIVSRTSNGRFFEIIETFGRHTGTFGLLNTSLNLHGYPIVNDASDLEFVLENSALDGVVTTRYLITRT